MSIEKVRAFMKERGMEDRILEFDVSSATVELAAQALSVEGALATANFFVYNKAKRKKP